MAALISLITTVYNREYYLASAIESLLQQTQGDFEYLIWDDGSTDNSLEIARKYAKIDNRISVIAAPHLGRVQALICAIAATTGEYLGLLDSDDLLAPTTLQETIEVLTASPNIGMVYTDYLVINEKTEVKGLGKRCQIPYSQDRLLVDFMTFHFRLLRRNIYQKIGGIDADFTVAMDYDLCLKVSEVTEIVHLPKPLYYYRTHQKSISHLQQLEQIHFTYKAINDALQRRGLADQLELEVQINPKFMLKRK